MGRRGPKPTPTAILEARGSWRAKERRAAGEVEPPLLTAAPRPPQGLDRRGRDMWKRLAPQLIALGVLAVTDLWALEHLCMSVDLYWQAHREIKRHGIMTLTPQGMLVENPAVRVRQKAETTFQRYCACFGLTPADRPKLTAAAAQGESEQEMTGPRLAVNAGQPKYF